MDTGNEAEGVYLLASPPSCHNMSHRGIPFGRLLVSCRVAVHWCLEADMMVGSHDRDESSQLQGTSFPDLPSKVLLWQQLSLGKVTMSVGI
jgi:hypothetical protein